MTDVDVAVVGAGPAGIAASLAAGRAGCDVLLIDKDTAPGGQVFRTKGGSPLAEGPIAADARRTLDLLDQARTVRFLGDTVVWYACPETGLGLFSGGSFRRIRPKAVVLAPGAYERTVPFAGWTMPGVMTLGAIQRILREGGTLPGRRFVLVGTGPLLYLTAHLLSNHGAEAVQVLDVQPAPTAAWRNGAAFWRQIDLLGYGSKIAWTLVRHRTPIRFGWTVTGVSGTDRVAEVIIGPVRRTDRAVRVEADTVGLGFGFLPRFELAAMLGGTVRYNDRQNGFEVRPISYDSAAVAPSVFLAGDGGTVGGYKLALAGGRAAGEEAAAAVNGTGDLCAAAGIHRHVRRAQSAVDRLYTLPHGIWRLPENMVVCRCEDVTRGDIDRAIADGATGLSEIRLRTRAGMGTCQGRNCLGNIAMILRQSGMRDRVQAPTVRPPVEPVPLGHLADLTVETDDCGKGGYRCLSR